MARRRGRSRKFRGTDPAKKPAHDKQPDDKIKMTRQPHRRPLRAEVRDRAEAESPIGRLLLAGFLATSADVTGAEPNNRYDAAIRYAFIVGSYRSVIGTPKETASGGKGYPCDATACEINRRAANDDPDLLKHCECLARKIRYDNVFEALANKGRRVLMAVNRVAIHREPIERHELVHLVVGLDTLALHFGYSRRRRVETEDREEA